MYCLQSIGEGRQLGSVLGFTVSLGKGWDYCEYQRLSMKGEFSNILEVVIKKRNWIRVSKEVVKNKEIRMGGKLMLTTYSIC